jgi:hypothetical protein
MQLAQLVEPINLVASLALEYLRQSRFRPGHFEARVFEDEEAHLAMVLGRSGEQGNEWPS